MCENVANKKRRWTISCPVRRRGGGGFKADSSAQSHATGERDGVVVVEDKENPPGTLLLRQIKHTKTFHDSGKISSSFAPVKLKSSDSHDVSELLAKVSP